MAIVGPGGGVKGGDMMGGCDARVFLPLD